MCSGSSLLRGQGERCAQTGRARCAPGHIEIRHSSSKTKGCAASTVLQTKRDAAQELEVVKDGDKLQLEKAAACRFISDAQSNTRSLAAPAERAAASDSWTGGRDRWFTCRKGGWLSQAEPGSLSGCSLPPRHPRLTGATGSERIRPRGPSETGSQHGTVHRAGGTHFERLLAPSACEEDDVVPERQEVPEPPE